MTASHSETRMSPLAGPSRVNHINGAVFLASATLPVATVSTHSSRVLSVDRPVKLDVAIAHPPGTFTFM